MLIYIGMPKMDTLRHLAPFQCFDKTPVFWNCRIAKWSIVHSKAISVHSYCYSIWSRYSCISFAGSLAPHCSFNDPAKWAIVRITPWGPFNCKSRSTTERYTITRYENTLEFKKVRCINQVHSIFPTPADLSRQ